MSNYPPASSDSVVLRWAGTGDAVALRRLAELDSAVVPAAPLLIAEVGGVPLAALSPGDRQAIADPFHPTAHLIELLAAHASHRSGHNESAARPQPIPVRGEPRTA
jgi:hypothetical protein